MAVTKRGNKAVGQMVEKRIIQRAYGQEPTIPLDTELSQIELSLCLTWYGAMCDSGESRDYLETYLRSTNDPRLQGVKRAPDMMLRTTAGWVARLLSRGAILSDETLATFNRLIEDTIRVRVVEAKDDLPEKAKPSVQQRVIDRTGDLIADVEDIVDNWEAHAGFSLYETLAKQSVSPRLVTPLISYYEPLHAELVAATDTKSKDVQAKEAYASMGKRKAVQYRNFIGAILDDARRYTDAVKAAKPRKQRAKKAKTPEEKFRFLKVMKECLEFKAKSVNPANVIGATELWLFDTRYKKLTVLRADSDRGLDIHRTTVTGFDPKTSLTKKIGRNTQQSVDATTRGTKAGVKKAFNALKSEAVEATGRLNENVILLRVFK